jgi:hemolysin activation/secretion protein
MNSNNKYVLHRFAVFFMLLGVLVRAEAQDVAQDAPPAKPVPFDILEYRVLGNSVLSAREIEAAVYPHLGPGKSLDDVEQARLALEGAYRAQGRGTVFVDIPEQDVGQDGVVRLKVTEGRLRQVRVTGARYFSGRQIRAALPSAEAAAVPDLTALQSELRALNTQTADRNIVPVLAAGSLPGTVNLTLRVEDKLPLHASVEINDQYTADTSRTRANFSLSYDNLFGRMDSVALQYQTAPEEPGELGVFVASYARNLGEGRRLAVYFVNSDSDVAALGTLNVLGKGQVYGARLIAPFYSSDRATHSFTAGLDYKDFRESIKLDAETQLDTPISYLHFSLADTSTWRFGEQLFSVSPSLNFGVRGLGNTEQEFADKRYRGRPDYFYLRASALYRTAPWHGFTVAATLAGQYTVDPVIGNEQFTIGGADGVRGYLEAERINDTGFKGSLQIDSPAWSLGFADTTLGGFVFFDAGRVSAAGALLDAEVRSEDLSSVGVGFRLASSRFFESLLTFAYPLVPGGRTEEGDSRFLFSLRASW